VAGWRPYLVSTGELIAVPLGDARPITPNLEETVPTGGCLLRTADPKPASWLSAFVKLDDQRPRGSFEPTVR